MNSAAKELRERLEGAFIPAMPVLFNIDGAHQLAAEKDLVKYHASAPIQGAALWVHTGRGLHLTHDDRHKVFKRWRIGLNPDQFIICGVGCPAHANGKTPEELSDAEYISRAADMAQEAKTYGADGILVYAPARFRGRKNQDELVLDYHDSVASVGLPMILFYLYEAAGGISYGINLLSSLLAMDSVAGIKVATLDSVVTFQNVARLIKEKAKGVALLTGEDRFLGYSLMCGADGALVGMGAVRPEFQAALVRHWREQNHDAFISLSSAIDLFSQALFIEPMEGYIRRILIALAEDGVIPMEAAYDPWGPPVPPSERVAIGAALNKLKAL